jgi:hypothetical protein
MGGAETLVGSLQEVAGAELLRMLALARHTGLLRVGSEKPHWAALADGDLVIAGSAAGPTLLQLLVTNGVITENAANSLTSGAMQSRAHDLNVLPFLLERVGAVKLYPSVREQTVSAVFQMLLPSQEEFTFVPGERLPIADHFQFPTEMILAEAGQRVAEWAEIAASITSTQSVFRPVRSLRPELPSVTLSSEEWTVLAVLDGRRTVAQTIAALGRSAHDVCAVLHRLLKSGLVERLD